jgi:hypothetical protein
MTWLTATKNLCKKLPPLSQSRSFLINDLPRVFGGVRVAHRFSFLSCVLCAHCFEVNSGSQEGQPVPVPLVVPIVLLLNRRGNQEWSIHRHWKQWAHKTHDRKLKRWATRTPPNTRGRSLIKKDRDCDKDGNFSLFQKRTRLNLYAVVFYRHCVNDAAGWLLVPEGIIRPLVSSSSLKCFMTYSHIRGWTQVLWKGKQFLLHLWHPSCYSSYKLPISRDRLTLALIIYILQEL